MTSLEGRPEPLETKVRALVAEAERESARASYEAALEHYRAALALGSGNGTRVLSRTEEAQLHARAARCLLRLGRTAEALRAMEEAAAAAAAAERVAAARPEAEGGSVTGENASPNPVLGLLTVEIALQWGEIYVELGDYRRALDRAQQAGSALEAARRGCGEEIPAALSSWSGRLHNLLGHIAARRGDAETAEGEFTRALTHFRRAGDLAGLATAFNNLGLAAKNRCQWSRAREYLTVSERLRSEGEETTPHGGSLHNLGLVHLKLGEWDQAAQAFEKSLDLFTRRADTQNQVRVLLGQGDLCRFRRDLDGAEEALRRAADLAGGRQFLRELAIAWLRMGEVAVARHQPARAQDLAERAEALALRIAPEGDLVAEAARLQAEVAVALGQGATAVERARAALGRARRLADPYEEALADGVLARAHDLVGEPDEAREAHLRATSRLRELRAKYPLAEALLAFATHLRRFGAEERGRARALLRESLARFEDCDDGIGPVWVRLEAARLECALGYPDAAAEELDRATEALGGGGGAREREALREVAAEVEETLVSQSLAARRVTSRARRETAPAGETPERVREQLADVLDATRTSCRADGALVALRRGPVAAMEILASAGLPGSWAQSFATRLPSGIEAAVAEGAPLVVLDARRAETPVLPLTEARAGDDARDVRSLLTVPLALGGGAQGLLYLDRLAGVEAPPFGQRDLHLAFTVAEELGSLVMAADLQDRGRQNGDLREKLLERVAFADVVTQNREMLEVLRLVSKVSATRMTVLIQGETGTGKQLIARAIHAASDRRHGPFVTIDCAALPENLLESELFGYRRGAFTGATQDRKGLAEEADGGTIFLDEIGKAGIGVQQRLLHLLDCGEIRSVGATSYRQLDVRVISATSTPDLRREVEEGRFLKDLYYRLNDFAVVVPPLRDRREDILLLAQYFLELFARECGRPTPELSRKALRLLLEFDWPGNVRELQKAMRRASVLAEAGEPILPEHLPPEIRQPERAAGAPRTGGGAGAGGGGDGEGAGNLHEAVEVFERRHILATLEKFRWNKSRAAEELGLSRKGLRNKIARMELERRGREGGARPETGRLAQG